MFLSDFTLALWPSFDPNSVKLHLASHNGRENPLDVFRAGNFQIWQQVQSTRSFQRPFVVSLVQLDNPDTWIFVGVWRSNQAPEWGFDSYAREVGFDSKDCWNYNLAPAPELRSLIGRAVFHYDKSFRQSYPNWETCGHLLELVSISEISEQHRSFNGYKNVRISMPELRRIIEQKPADWHTALSAVGGVYLITASDGTQYVGSASGQEGFWGRWRTYAQNGHGDNALLKRLLKDTGENGQGDGSCGFHFSILETADTRTDRNQIIEREGHWKTVLGSRAHGLNLN